jgi:DNA polymerase III gamma/tau subunit
VENHPDVKELNAANTRGIDDIRALTQEAKFKPQRGNLRIIILDEAQQLTPQATQALLKPLEAPPAHTVYIVCTMEVDKVHPALIGRCNRIDLARITRDQLAVRLSAIAKAESHKIPADVVEKIADLSGGQVRDSIQILDAVIQTIDGAGKVTDKVLGEALASVEVTDDKVAAKVLLGIYLGNRKVVHGALLDAQDYFQLANKLMYLNTYMLDTLYVEKHPQVWHTQQNRGFKKLCVDKGCKPNATSILLVQNALLSLKQELGAFALPERHLMTARLCALALSVKQTADTK